jgi:hypothetical protein
VEAVPAARTTRVGHGSGLAFRCRAVMMLRAHDHRRGRPSPLRAVHELDGCSRSLSAPFGTEPTQRRLLSTKVNPALRLPADIQAVLKGGTGASRDTRPGDRNAARAGT